MTQPAFKLAVVVDNTLPAGLAANAAAVMTLTLGHLHGDRLIGPDLTDRSNRRQIGRASCRERV